MHSIVYILGNAVGKCIKNNTGPTCTSPSNCLYFISVINALSCKCFYFLSFSSFSGKYGINFGPLFLVHMLYVSVSVWACFRIFSQPSSRSILTVNCEQNMLLLQLRILQSGKCKFKQATYLFVLALCPFSVVLTQDFPSCSAVYVISLHLVKILINTPVIKAA